MVGAIVISLVALLCCTGTISGQSNASNQYKVKAAFLFHVAQFVEWPEGTFRDANSPLVYCTVGTDPFQGMLDASFQGKTIGAHTLQVKHFKEINEAQGCHVVFLGKPAKRKSIPNELASIKGSPVLTVGDTERFVDDSGMIGFCLEENKIGFEVNLDSAEKAHLKISAKLLALAKRVIVG